MKIKFFAFSRTARCGTLFELPVSAQITRGSIAGTVRDASGAVVAGANVRVTSGGTNISRTVTTNESGFFRVGALDPGTYTVVVEATGFSGVQNQQVVVQPSLETSYDAELAVGSVTEIVNVTGTTEGVTLNKTNATIGLTTTARQAAELPLSAGRNVNNLALLSPNVHLGSRLDRYLGQRPARTQQ
jgi:hypothetical protein